MPAPSATSPAPSRPPCPNEASVAADGSARKGPVVRDDIDGDGMGDSVWLAIDPGGPLTCRAFVVMRSGASIVAAPITDLDASALSTLNLPALEQTLAIDRRKGAEVVVDVTAGASTVLLGVFTVNQGVLSRVAIRGVPGSSGDLLAYGGSVGHIGAVDCRRRNLVLVSEAVARARGYEVTRRVLAPDGATWTVRPKLSRRASVSFERVVRRYPEFGRPPFSSC